MRRVFQDLVICKCDHKVMEDHQIWWVVTKLQSIIITRKVLKVSAKQVLITLVSIMVPIQQRVCILLTRGKAWTKKIESTSTRWSTTMSKVHSAQKMSWTLKNLMMSLPRKVQTYSSFLWLSCKEGYRAPKIFKELND